VVGGKTHSRRFPVEMARSLGDQAAALAKAAGGSVLLTTSRRTGRRQEQVLAAAVPEPRFMHLWSQGGDNPFFGMLALADATVVTGDSVSMCCEACSATAPVYVFAPPGWCVPKHERLHQELYERGLARPFASMTGFEPWTHPSLNPAADIAAAVKARLGG
jgi:mitochondrial fission protein ELM1